MLRVASDYSRLTDTGRQRAANEDSYFARSPLFAVADGMGGAQAGEVASAIAVSVLDGGLPDGRGSVEQRLAGAVQDANAQIHERSRSEPELSGMGTTFTGLYLGEDDITVAHVGDSRAYRWRDGELTPLTEDHSLVGEFIRQGKLTPEEAEEHPQRSIITRALGPEAEVQVDTHTWHAQGGDWYLLCSDGLTSMIPEARVAELLAGAATPAAATRALVDAANAAGGRDNITVIVFRVEEVSAGSGAPATEELQATTIGQAAPRAADVRRAVEEHEARAAEAEARRRQPRLPAAPAGPPPKRKRRRLRRVLALVAVLVSLLAIVVVGGYFASQTVYFVGSDDQGFVTLYRGVPYELPFGIELYTENFVTGVNVDELPATRRKALLDQRLRSRDDAVDLVRSVEQGNIASQ